MLHKCKISVNFSKKRLNNQLNRKITLLSSFQCLKIIKLLKFSLLSPDIFVQIYPTDKC